MIPNNEEEPLLSMEKMVNRLDEMIIKQRGCRAKEIEGHGPRNGQIKKTAVEIFAMDGLECWIVKSPMWEGLERDQESIRQRIANGAFSGDDFRQTLRLQVGYNGYVLFKERPVVEPTCSGILSYVPVHGGITYAEHDEVGSVYGFDTGHCDSQEFPIRDPEWIRGQIDVLARGILLAASIEEYYLAADGDNQRRAELVQPIVNLQPGTLSSVAMINLFTGNL